jgi:hypothetical protein
MVGPSLAVTESRNSLVQKLNVIVLSFSAFGGEPELDQIGKLDNQSESLKTITG